MKVIFYVAATCGNIDFHFIANLEHQFVITSSLTTLFWSVYLLHARGTVTELRNRKKRRKVLQPVE